MREHTTQEFKSNIKRVRNFIQIYKSIDQRAGGGRISVHKTDVLRAAVVFLHASIEELFRNLLKWRLPYAEEKVLDEILLPGFKRVENSDKPEKFGLGRLKKYKGENVENFIRDCIDGYANYMNINNSDELSGWIRKIGLKSDDFSSDISKISSLFERRHLIVHQTDRNYQFGLGQHRAKSLSRATVERWTHDVESFVEKLLQKVPD